MHEYDRCVRDCKLSIKALQNVDVSCKAFERLCSLVDSEDFLVLTSLFHTAVIRYAKPFVSADFGDGSVRYPWKHLKAEAGFSRDTHEHILSVRNTLIAHDDFTQIEPRIVMTKITMVGDESFPIPVSIAIANKCISHPANLGGAEKMKSHTLVVGRAIANKLSSDIERLRALAIAHPEHAENSAKYTGGNTRFQIPAGGARTNFPDPLKEPWLNPNEPDFAEVHNGYQYEMYNLKKEFYGPEDIKLPSGNTLRLTP